MTDISLRKFVAGLLFLSFAYLGFEYWFNAYAMISVDEFWFAHRIFQYIDGLPYRDFSPYKTVLGYYILVWPMSLSANFISTLIFTKNFIALLNACVLLLAASWLTKFFSRTSVLASLLLLFCMDITLSFSSNIRVDLFAYWFCLFSLLSLLDRRFILAGLLLGLGFATSQKAIWYWFASNTALATHWWLAARDRQYFMDCVRFNLTVVGTILAYLFFWSCFAGWQVVVNNVFVEAAAMYHLDWYDASRLLYWRIILTLNPLAFLLWPLTIISILGTSANYESYSQRRFIIIYSCTILFCLMAYKQVFPYYMQVTLPIFLVLYTAFFSWLFQLSPSTPNRLQRIGVFGYIALTSTVVYLLELPAVYLLINVCPLLILLRMNAKISLATFRLLLAINLVFIGMVYPFAIYTQKLLTLDSRYQKANLLVMQKLLEDGSDYTAGIELIYNKTQPIAGLRHLMGPAISYLYTPSENLKPVMTAALYEDPSVTPASINQALANSHVKFYVNNYRMHYLPRTITDYLANHYQHYWGSIYLYAPVISAGKHQTILQFTGDYKLQTNSRDKIEINGKYYRDGEKIKLLNNSISSNAVTAFRLALIPDESALDLDTAFNQDQWEKIIF